MSKIKIIENSNHITQAEFTANKEKIVNTFRNYGIEIKSIEVTAGPVLSLYEILHKTGASIFKIRDLEIGILATLKEFGTRFFVPIPGKGTICIELPNKNPKEVSLQSILTSNEFQNSPFDLPIVLGETFGNKNVISDLAKLPHLLVGGATGQGKSVFLHAIINSLLHKKRPEELKLVLIDTKNQQFIVYADLKNHFLARQSNGESQIISDTKKVIEMLNSLCQEMDNRYKILKQNNVLNLKEYNQLGKENLPYVVVVLDELVDLFAIAGKKVEMPIASLAQLGRSVGIHLVIATQRPSLNVISEAIKANFPAKVAFRVSSIVDSRTILDAPGAEHLLGLGDMLFKQGNELVRIQSAFIDTPEIEKLVKSISEQTAVADTFILPEITDKQLSSEIEKSDLDPFFEEASKWAKQKKQVSIDQIRRKFAVAHIRAGRILEQLKVNGIVK
jgi:S-DNA-T family DNA segregation ATPase FtsK/SpoIIIE